MCASTSRSAGFTSVRPATRLLALGALALGSIVAYMTLGTHGHWDFILPFRGVKLAAMLLVAFCVAVSSVLFQTITHNRILTPSIMGFDALYVLIQASVIFVFGVHGTTHWPAEYKFAAEVAAMILFSTLLFQWIFNSAGRSLYLLVLVGIVFGLLFRSLSSFVIRLIDPNEFLVLQDRLFASFNAIQSDLLGMAGLIVLAAVVAGWHQRHDYDVLALGKDAAISLGVPYRRTLMVTLVLIAICVSIATALVGPVTFFGLLASNLAYIFMQSDRHRHTLPAAVLIATVLLVGGQMVLERLLGLSTPVSVIIEFAGGLMFIALVVRTRK